MRIAVDTNILAYAEGVDDADREVRARRVLQALPPDQLLIPVQVLGELYSELRRKRRVTPDEARKIVLTWWEAYETAGTTLPAMTAALALAVEHGLQIWDAIILAVAAESGCDILLSEDMHAGFTWGGVTVMNPFATPPHPLLPRLTPPGH